MHFFGSDVRTRVMMLSTDGEEAGMLRAAKAFAIDDRTKDNLTPLIPAASSSPHTEVIATLLKAEAKEDGRDDNGKT